jgi:hypothetical protein
MIGNMLGISDALVSYRNAGGQRIDEMYIIYKECMDWLKKHTNSFFASVQNQLEESVIRTLMHQVESELDVVQPGLGTALANYQGRKVHNKPSKHVKALDKGYDLERKTYLASGKTQSPFSATKIHGALDDNFDFSKISLNTWNATSQTNASTRVRMYFLNKIQRLKNLVTCVDVGNGVFRWVDIANNLVTFPLSPLGRIALDTTCQLYAMDRYGNVFFEYDNASYGRIVLNQPINSSAAAIAARGQTNHSTICAGREVICAGMIFFWKGQLIHIDNESGHYKPNRAALYQCVNNLRLAGTDMALLRVKYSTAQGADFFKANTFLTNGQPDWPDQNQGSDQMPIYQNIPGFVV